MARQSSFIKLEGTIGDVTFYKGANGSFARQKGGVSKSRIMNDPKFQRTRENLAEFARAAAASQLLKNAFREIILRSKDLRTHNRLYALAMKVLKTDLINPRGERAFEEGDMSLVKGFQFNANAMWNSTVFAQYTAQDAASEINVEFETFVPGSKIASPLGATHARIFLVTASLNVPDGIFETNVVTSTELILDHQPLSGLTLQIDKIAGGATLKAYALGIEFLQLVNGTMYGLNNNAHNAAVIFKVE